MKTYTLSADVTPAPTTTPDDALAIAVQAVDALTVVEKMSAKRLGRSGIVNLKVTFLGLNDNEARATAETTYAALRRTAGALLSTDPIVLSGVNL